MEPFILPPWDHHKCCSIIQPSSELQAPPGRQLGDVRLHSDSLSPAQIKYSHRNHEALERLNGRESAQVYQNLSLAMIIVPQLIANY